MALAPSRRHLKELRDRHPRRVPVLLTCETPRLQLQKNKLLVPKDLSIMKLLWMLRKRLPLRDSEALFVYTTQKTLVCGSVTMHDLHCSHAEDGVLHLVYATENTFGGSETAVEGHEARG